MATNNEDIKWLYGKFKAKGYDIGTEQEFTNSLGNDADRQWYYEKAKGMGLNMGSMDDFNSLYAPQKTQPAAVPKQQVAGTPAATTAPTSAAASAQPERQVAQTQQPQQLPTAQTQPKPQQPTWQPTEQEKVQMSYGLNTMLNNFNKSSRERVAKIKRTTMNMTPEGRAKLKAGKFQAQLAGAPTKMLGLTPNASQSVVSTTEKQSDNGAKPIESGQSPQPHGVKYVNGKAVTEWLLPDGTLTTSIVDADKAEYGARTARLRDQFIERMKQNGLDPSKQEDVEMQTQYDAQAPAYDVVAELWEDAEKKHKADRDRNADREWNSYNSLGGGRELRVVTTAMNTHADNMSHMTRFDLQKMMDNAWKRAGQKVMANCYDQLHRQNPNASDQELQNAASKMARQLTDNAVYQYAVQQNTPKSTLEYFGRTVADMNVINSISKGLARSQAGASGDLAAQEAAMAEYGKDHRVAQIAGTVAGMAADPTTWASGAVGSLIGKGAISLGGRIMARKAATTMGSQIGSRLFSSTLAGRLATGAAAGGGIFATYEMLKEGESQFLHGGHVNPETGETGGYSAGDILSAGGHGLILGSVTGTLTPVIGNVADKLVKATSSTVGKAGARLGEVAVSTAAEGTIFAMPEWYDNANRADSDPNKRSNFDIWTDNMAMMLGFKAQHGLKSAPRVIASLRPIKPVDGRPLTQAERNHNRMDFEERVRKALDASPSDLSFTADEREELRRAGYSDLTDLFSRDKEQPIRKTANPADRALELYMDRAEGEEIYNDNPDFDGYSDMEMLMQDKGVSQAARAKAYYILTGRRLPMSSVTGYTTNTDAEGRVTVNATASDGEVITCRTFKNEEAAKQETDNIMRQAELNSIDVGERYKEAEADDRVLDAAIREVSPKADAETVKRIYRAVKAGNKDATESQMQLAELIDGAIAGNKHIGDIYRPDAIRDELKEKTGIDVDAAIRKMPSKRTEAEQKAVETYIECLYPDEARQAEPAPEQAEAQRQYEQGRLLYGRYEEGDPTAQPDADEIALRMEQAYKAVEDAFGPEAEYYMYHANENPWALLEDPELSADQEAAILYYVNAKAALDGVMDASNEAADNRRAEVQESVERRTHKDNGMIIQATMKVDDKPVYIVKGDVVMFPDGTTVDVRNSSESIIVMDPESGEYKFASPEQVFKVSEPVGPQDELAAAMAEIDQEQGALFSGWGAEDEAPEPGQTEDNAEGEGVPEESEAPAMANIEEYDKGYEYGVNEAKGMKDDMLNSEIERLRNSGWLADYGRGLLEGYEFKQQNRAMAAQAPTDPNVGLEGPRHAFDQGTPSPEILAEDSEPEQKTVDAETEAQQQTALSRVPLNDEGEPSFETVDKETAWDALVEVAGSEKDAGEIALAQIQQANADFETLSKKPPTMKAPKLKGSPMAMAQAKRKAAEQYQNELAQYNQQIAEAQARIDAWNSIAAVHTTRQAEQQKLQEEERRQRDAEAHDKAVAQFEEDQRVKAEKEAEQERIGVHAVNPKIKDKWDAAPKVEGNADAITLPDGSMLTGRYVLTEAGAASPSHDVNNGYQPTEGFPIDENGQSVNDRDYMRDKDAQQIVEGMAGNYDNRALQDPVIVSQDGVVLSGNNRTMSGDLAAGRGTDKAYVDYLAQFGHKKFGFTPEQVSGMRNPRVVFVPDEALPYDATTFARFNAQEKKSQGKPEAAVKLGKIVPDNVFNGIVTGISRYDRLSDYYTDEKAVAQALSALMEAKVINDKQLPEMRTGTTLSAVGKELIENTLIGKVFQAQPDAVRQIISVPTSRQSVVMGLSEIANNRTLAKAGYDISDELAKAVDLVARAKTAMPDVYTDGMPVSPFGRMQGLFDDEFGDSRVTDATTLLLADILNSGRPSDLRKILATYNAEASQAAVGQRDIFTGTIPTKEEILTTVNEHFRNATPKEQQALVDAAIAERKRRAEADAEQRERSEASEQTPHDDERRAEPQQPTAGDTEFTELEPLGKDRNDLYEDTPDEAALRARISVGDEWEEEGPAPDKPIYKRKLYVDGKHEVIQTDAPDKNGSYTGSQLSFDGRDFGDLKEIADYIDGGMQAQQAEPTEAQKAAGNYKMEHRRVDGYNISIENAKGSVRRGTGADGKQWETVMQNDYGYIRGTEGVDGDHIDVFLSDTPEEGDVFVVDQVNEDGSFDEHKVMYGFPTEQAARDAYLSNYEPGWTGLGAITHVSKDEFKKWIQSSRRKTKPFAEYKSVKPIEGNGMIGRSLTEQEATELIERMEATAEIAPTIELTPKNWIAQFGEDGTVETPIGIVKMGANQLLKLYSTKRTGYFGMIHPTLSTPDVILEEADPKEGSERDSKYLFVKTFVKSDGSRIVHFESVTVKKDGMEVSISSHEIKDKSLKNKMQNDIVLHLDEKLSPSSELRLTEAPSESEGPDLVPTSDNIVKGKEREDGQSLILPSESSEEAGALSGPTLDSPTDRKVNTLSADKQAASAESSEPYTITATTYTNKKGKTSDVHLVKFNRELTAEEKTALDTFAREPLTEGKKTSRGWYDRKQDGYMMRSEEAARQLAEMIGNEEAVADAQPMTAEELREAVAPAAPAEKKPARKPKKAPINRVSLEDVMTDLSTKGETKLSDHAEPVKAEPEQQHEISDDEMQSLADELRDLLGIGDDEGDTNIKFRDPGELTAQERQRIQSAGIRLAMGLIERGTTAFPDYATKMVGLLGDKIRPWLKSFYEGARWTPGYDKYTFTPTEQVATFDVQNFDKKQADPIAQAAMIVEECKAEAASAQAQKELTETRNKNRRENDKQTETDTAALAEKAEAVAGEAEVTAQSAGTGEAGRKRILRDLKRVDDTLEEVNDQLALLGYYEAEEVDKDFNEAYGYMRNAEKKAVKDAVDLAKQLVNDLGLGLDKVTGSTTANRGKRKNAVTANIAPAGGDISIRLPLNEGRELYITIGLDPSVTPGDVTYSGDNLQATRIMYRVEWPDEKGHVSFDRMGRNCWADANVTYADLLNAIQREAKEYLPSSTTAEEPAKAEPQEEAYHGTVTLKDGREAVVIAANHVQNIGEPSRLTDYIVGVKGEPGTIKISPDEIAHAGAPTAEDKPSTPAKAEETHNGYKIGDEVLWDRYGNDKWEKQTIVDFEKDGSPIFDSMGIGMMMEIGDWSRIKPADGIFGEAQRVVRKTAEDKQTRAERANAVADEVMQDKMVSEIFDIYMKKFGSRKEELADTWSEGKSEAINIRLPYVRRQITQRLVADKIFSTEKEADRFFHDEILPRLEKQWMSKATTANAVSVLKGEKKPSGKSRKSRGKEVTLKADEPIGGLFADINEEPEKRESDEREGNKERERVAHGQLGDTVGTDASGADGGIPAGGTESTDKRESADEAGTGVERGADESAHGTDADRGLQPVVGDRGRDESRTDSGSSDTAVERGRTSGASIVSEHGADRGTERLSAGESAAEPGGGSRPSAVKKPKRPEARYTRNFRYDEKGGNEADSYTATQRLEANVKAIETLADVLFGDTPATEEQKATMSRFRGWGQVDLGKYYDIDHILRNTYPNAPINRLARVIKKLDPQGEKKLFEAIKRASLSSYYTPTPIARAMNTFLPLAGYKGGSLLDPSMGNGMFEGTLPKGIQERTMITGVELDWLSGQLSRVLYPDAKVQIGAFEKSGIAPGSFDIVTSNVPFGDIAVNDPTWKNDSTPLKRSAQNRIHNYYAVKMLEATRPGGLVSMMTTSAVMDTPSNQNIRAHIADQGEILGAIRLPDNTFQGTGVVTDIIFVRKWRDDQDREQTREDESYKKTERAFLTQYEKNAPNKLDGTEQKVSYNGYYKLNPRNMVGEIQAGNQYGKKDAFGLTSHLTVDEIATEVEKTVKRIVGSRRGSLFNPTRTIRETQQAIRAAYKGDGDWVSNGNLVVQDGKVGVLTTKSNEYSEVSRTFEATLKHDRMMPRIKGMIELRTAMKKLIAAQIEGEKDETLATLRGELRKAYDRFASKFGRLQDKGNSFILDDIDGYTIQALEVWKNGKYEGLSDIFTKNSIKPALRLDGKKTPQEAVALSLAEYGYLRPDYMEKALGPDWAEQCGDVVFLKPNSEDDYVTRDEYLSGDVVTKLAEARAAAEKNPAFERNVKALEEVQPARIPFDDIAIHLGARWIPEDVLSDFVNELFGIHAVYSSRNRKWDPELGRYVNEQKSGVRYIPETDSFEINIEKKELGGAASEWETPKKSAKEILQAALEDKTLLIKTKDREGNERIDEEQTELANQKIADLRERFETWLPSDPGRVELLEQTYNDRLNRTVKRHFDGSHLVVPGLMGKELRPHQKDAVWMLINNRGGIVDHIVGAGKTLVMQAAIMEMRRMGIAKKPMIVALKSTVSQIAREFKESFPSARVLAPTDTDFAKENRKKFIANISLNDYDCVILSHEQYCMLPHTDEAERAVIDEQLWQLNNMIEYLYGTDDKSQMTKKQINALEKRRENLKAKLEKRLDRAVDREFCFENLGVDYLFVDESHQFKSLPYVTSYQKVAGLGDAKGSNRAIALLTGIRYLQRMHQGDKGTVFLSGTTITNSLVETYNLLNYLRPRKLEELGMPTFDAWASTFAVHSSELEATVTGGFSLKDRFRQFDNVAELSQLYAEIADVRNDQNLKLPKPGIEAHTVIVPASDTMSEINSEIVNMIESKNGQYFGIYPQDPNRAPWGLHASTISAKAAVSPRLIFPDAEDDGGKVHAVCENVKKYYDEMTEQRGVQLIFCEMGVPGKGKEYDAYTDMVSRFVNDYGIPRSEIAYIQEANNDEKRKDLFQRVRDGKVRILIGGTKNMGTGVNVQDRITDMHMLTVPWTPSALEQCIGRGSRQGNAVARDFMGNKVRVHYYATEGSLDLYKYQLLDAKGKMITQFKMGTTSGTRSFDEGSADEEGNMDPAEMVAILSGNPVIFERAKQEKAVKKLRALRNGFERDYQRKKAKYEELKTQKENYERLIRLNDIDRADLEHHGFKPDDKGVYPATVTVNDTGSYYGGRTFDKPKEAGEYLLAALDNGKIVTLQGFGQRARVVVVNEEKGSSLFSFRELQMGEGNQGSIRYSVRLSDDATAAGTAFRNLLKRILDYGEVYRRNLEEINSQLSGMNIGDGIFPRQAEYDEAITKLKELNAEYNKLGKKSDTPTTGDGNKYRLVDEGELLDFLDAQPLKKGYRYSQWANMGVLPPMSAKQNGEWRAPMIFSRWEQSEEGMRKENGKADLVQGNGRTTGDVAYNPYFHIRTSPLNDQFTAAYDRPELIVVEGYYPESEETSSYQAEGAKDSVGLMDWHSGSVNSQLSDDTKVQTMLSRYFKPGRIVPWSEVADLIMERVGDQKITFPINAVPPMLRAELAKRGAKFGDISGSVAEADIPMLNELRDRVNAGEWDAGLEKARAYLDAYESSTEAKAARVADLSQKANTPVRIVRTLEEADSLPTRRERRAKGWWSSKEDEVVIVLPNNVNVADVDNTFVHEVVGHKGLRALVGEERFDEFLDEVYDHASNPIRKVIDKMTDRMVSEEADRLRVRKAQAHERAGEDVNANYYTDMASSRVEAEKKREEYRKEATEEYMADLGGRIGSEGFTQMSRDELTLWGRIKAKVQAFLDKFLRCLKIAKSIRLNDKDLSYILYKSWKNLRKKGVFADAEDVVMRRRTGYDADEVTRFRDPGLGLEETITKMKAEAMQANADNLQAKRDAMRAIGGNLNHLRQAMTRQREYDITTVKSVADLARVLMDNNLLDDLSKYETKRILGAINNVVGKQDVSQYVQKVMDIMVDNQLRMGANTLGRLLSIRGSRVDARGIEVQGELDPDGQRIAQVVRKSTSLPKDDIDNRIAEAINRMSSTDQAIADEATIEYAGLQIARQYVEDITESKAEEKALRDSIREAKEARDAGQMTEDAYRQYVESTEDAIRQNKIERAEAFHSLVEQIGGVLTESVERAKAWREAEKQRVEEIHHNANSDMEGRPTDEHHKDDLMQKMANNSFARFLLSPLATFDQMLRMFGKKNSRGEGYLWNRYMRDWVTATEKEYTGYRDALKVLDAKVSEIYGKDMTWGDLFTIDRKLPKASVRFFDGGEMKEHELTQGNLLYIYMADKMSDGRMKLRHMGITESDVEDIKNFLDPRFIELADWMQEEFLVDKRNEYNEVHKRMFGASMAAIENYFPLKILANARLEDVDVADDTTDTALPATSTGSIIKRRRNNLALDVTGANAFSVILDHLQQMERWAAFAEFNRDLNTLLSYKRFRNQVMNMSSVYGAGKTLWNNFRNVCSMAAGTYRPPIAALDKSAVNIAKGVTAAKVSFRVFTALKQFLSMPAYMSDSNPAYLAENIANPIGAWRWSMKNLPLFEKRWRSRMAGDPRLLKSEMDWKMWRSRVVELASRVGMAPNAFVDALTVAIGTHAMYQTKLAKYKRQGYDPDVAEERAKQDATILFNQTQQSSEGAFLSTMQVDRSWLSVLFTVFRNSSMSYTRQLYDSIRNIGRRLKPGYATLSESFMAKQMARDGIDPDKADRNAKQEYRRGVIRDLVRVGVFGYVLQLAWNLGAYLPYLIFGEDDEEKDKMWNDVFTHTMFGSIEGLTGGDVYSNTLNAGAKGEKITPWIASKDMPLASDLENIWDKWNKDEVSAMNDVINLLMQSAVGVNPQSLTDAVVAVMDACGDDADTSRECALLMCRVINCPQSQLDKIYFDELGANGEEASRMTPREIADRYARYKVRRGAPLTGWAYGNAEREKAMEKYREKSDRKAKERLARETDTKASGKMAGWLDEFKATKERVSEIQKVKSRDEEQYYRLLDQMEGQPEYIRYEIIKAYKHDVDELTKTWLNAKSPEERDAAAGAILQMKRELTKELEQTAQ